MDQAIEVGDRVKALLENNPGSEQYSEEKVHV